MYHLRLSYDHLSIGCTSSQKEGVHCWLPSSGVVASIYSIQRFCPTSVYGWCFKVVFLTPCYDGELHSGGECKRHRNPRNQSRFLQGSQATLRGIPRSSENLRPRRLFYRDLVEGIATLWPLWPARFVGIKVTIFMILLLAVYYLKNSEFSLTWKLIRNMLPLNDVAFR